MLMEVKTLSMIGIVVKFTISHEEVLMDASLAQSPLTAMVLWCHICTPPNQRQASFQKTASGSKVPKISSAWQTGSIQLLGSLSIPRAIPCTPIKSVCA